MCIKSKNRVFIASILCVVLVGFVLLPSVVAVDKTDAKIIVIDPGHGGLDSGVSSESGVKESDLVLTIALCLGEYLKSGGFDVVYTRKNKSALVGGRFVKKTDMKRRVEIIKKAGADVVVSIHLNSFSDRRRKGIQVFFGNDRSKPLASLMQNQLNEKFNLIDAGRNFSVLKTDKYILNESPCPAIIIECGFLSNPDDERNLLDDNYRHRLAQGIYEGLLLWAFGEGA